MELYTKDGNPLQVYEDKVFSRSGNVVGRIKDKKVFGPNGRYVGTIIGEHLIYRSTDSAGINPPFTCAKRSASAKANRAKIAVWGDEPTIPA
ncbi:4-fold beta flower protein [Psychromonas sp. PT13]|uniref:4-fold beta flower protein n=1 Tax=Psychromonas sp. PT13 TaxID=3439547 RepID=UPI003EB91164